MKKILVIGIITLLLSTTALSGAHAITSIERNTTNAAISVTTPAQSTTAVQYTPHEPIVINGDDEFTMENGVTRGSGTATDPYIIEGWDINASKARKHSSYGPGGISIGYTSAYFIIQNCYIHDGSNKILRSAEGILLDSVKNGKIDHCTVENNRNGILLSYGKHITISNCVFSSNTYKGIDLMAFCKHNEITHCDFTNNKEGINIGVISKYNTVSNCNFTTADYGIDFFGSGRHNTITNCQFHNIKKIGIALTETTSNRIENITLSDTKNGIMLFVATNNEIKNCVIKRSYLALSLIMSSRNTISQCNIDNNNQGMMLIASLNNHVTNCNIRNNTIGLGALLHGIGNHINYNNIEGNNCGAIKTETVTRLDARHNWWGSPDGPSGKGNGEGDSVRWSIGARIIFSPWLETRNTDAGPQ